MDHNGRGILHLRRARRWAPALTVAAVLVGSTTALGAVASQTASIQSQQMDSPTAVCPVGTGVVSNGFASPDFDITDNRSVAVRLGSRRTGTRSVKTDSVNFGQNAGAMVSIAYCTKAGRRVSVASKESSSNSVGLASVVARCPRGSRAVGGGFATPVFSLATGPVMIPITSRKVGKRGWRAQAINMAGSDGPAGKLVAYAHCLEGAPKLVTRSKRGKAPGQRPHRTVVRCPAGTKAVSGGFDANLDEGMAGPIGTAITSRRAKRGRAWRIRALSVDQSESASVTAYVYCRPA